MRRTFWRRALGLTLAMVAAAGAAKSAREPAASPLFVAFYVPWEKPALASLSANVGAIDVFSPMWGSLVSPKGEVRWESDPEAHAVLAHAGRRPKVFPIVSNAHDDVWDRAAAEGVVADPVAAQAFADGLVAQAKADGYGGYVMDFENLTPQATAAYPGFLAQLKKRLNAAGLEVWVTSTLTNEDGLGQDLDGAVDTVVLMAYDQCWATSEPGPIAADAWLAANLAAKLARGDPQRYVVALASYGYDWPQGRKAEVVAAQGAAALAADTGQPVAHEPGAGAHLVYRAPDGTAHDVWWTSGADFARQRALAEQRRVRGVALWRMGLEDPALWKTPRASAPVTPQGPAASCEPLKPAA